MSTLLSTQTKADPEASGRLGDEAVAAAEVLGGVEHHQGGVDLGQRRVDRRLHALVSESKGFWKPGRSSSTSWKSGPPTTPLMRRRVVCGWSETMLTLLPTRRLTSVDLPTLGRPSRAMNPDWNEVRRDRRLARSTASRRRRRARTASSAARAAAPTRTSPACRRRSRGRRTRSAPAGRRRRGRRRARRRSPRRAPRSGARPPSTAAASAARSAHRPAGYDAFSTLTPTVRTRPTRRRAARRR